MNAPFYMIYVVYGVGMIGYSLLQLVSISYYIHRKRWEEYIETQTERKKTHTRTSSKQLLPTLNEYKKAVDAQGYIYYYHTITRQSTWEIPPDGVLVDHQTESNEPIPDKPATIIVEPHPFPPKLNCSMFYTGVRDIIRCESLPISVSLFAKLVYTGFFIIGISWIVHGLMLSLQCIPNTSLTCIVEGTHQLINAFFSSLVIDLSTCYLLALAHVITLGLLATMYRESSQHIRTSITSTSVLDSVPEWIRYGFYSINLLHVIMSIGVNITETYLDRLWPDALVLYTFASTTTLVVITIVYSLIQVIPMIPTDMKQDDSEERRCSVSTKTSIVLFCITGIIVLLTAITFQILRGISESNMDTTFSPQEWSILPGQLDIINFISIPFIGWKAWTRPMECR